MHYRQFPGMRVQHLEEGGRGFIDKPAVCMHKNPYTLRKTYLSSCSHFSARTLFSHIIT